MLLDATQPDLTGVWSAAQHKLDLSSHNLQSQQIEIGKRLQIDIALSHSRPSLNGTVSMSKNLQTCNKGYISDNA